MRALVLERQHELSLRDIDLPQKVGPGDVKVKIHTVGICGSDVHYYTHGKIGPFVVNAPMVLGHEAAGTIVEVGRDVKNLKSRRPGLHGAGRSRSELAGEPPRHVQRRSRGDVLGDAADPRRAHALCRPSGELHLQASRQRQLRRRRDGGAVRRRHAGRDQGKDHARRHRGRARRRADRHDGGAGGARRGLRARDRRRSRAAEARHRRALPGRHPGQYPREEPGRRR